MLETIREYARERLEELPELSSAARQAHAEHFADFAQSRRDRLYGAEREQDARRAGVRARQPADGLALLGGRRRDGSDRETARCAVGAPRRPRLVSRGDRPHERLAGRARRRSVEARSRAERDHHAHEPRARAPRDPRLHAGGRGAATTGRWRSPRKPGELPQRVPVLRSLASFHLYPRRVREDRDASAAGSWSSRSSRPTPALQVDGHLLVGASVAFSGDLQTGLEHLDRAIALFDPHRHQPGAFRLGPSPGVVAHTTSGLLRWLLGQPERAEEPGLTALRAGAGAEPPVHARLHAVPCRLPRPLATRVRARPRAGERPARGRRGARLPDLDERSGSSSRAPR